MASIFDYITGGADPAPQTQVGPQSDGTNLPSGTAIMAQPQDAAGGAPAQYSSQILDLFKFGIGQYAATQQSAQLFDYKKFEATQGGVYQQGKAATLPAATTGGISPLVIMGIVGIALVAYLTHRG